MFLVEIPFISQVIDAILGVIIDFVAEIPGNNFQYVQYLSTLRGYLGYLNWFIPVYTFSQIFSVWLAVIMTFFTILFVIKLIIRFSGG